MRTNYNGILCESIGYLCELDTTWNPLTAA